MPVGAHCNADKGCDAAVFYFSLSFQLQCPAREACIASQCMGLGLLLRFESGKVDVGRIPPTLMPGMC